MFLLMIQISAYCVPLINLILKISLFQAAVGIRKIS